MTYFPNNPPRKVHLFRDNTGKRNRGGRPLADSYCDGNFPSPDLLTTRDPAEVTCIPCLRKMGAATKKAYKGSSGPGVPPQQGGSGSIPPRPFLTRGEAILSAEVAERLQKALREATVSMSRSFRPFQDTGRILETTDLQDFLREERDNADRLARVLKLALARKSAEFEKDTLYPGPGVTMADVIASALAAHELRRLKER